MTNIVVSVPGHGDFEFPEGTSDDEMSSSINRYLDDPQGGASVKSAMDTAAGRLGKSGFHGNQGSHTDIGQNYGGVESLVQGIPIVGAYQPTSDVGAAYQQQHPLRAQGLHLAGGALGSIPALALGPAGALGETAAAYPALTAMGTSGVLGGADTAARGGSGSDIMRDAIVNALGSGAGSLAGKALGAAAKPFVPKVRPTATGWQVRTKLTPSDTDFIPGAEAYKWMDIPKEWESELRSFEEHGFKIRPRIENVTQPLSHEKVQSIGTGLGALIGSYLGSPEAGAFIGYGMSPGLAEHVGKAAPWIANNADKYTINPITQGIVWALGKKAEDKIKTD